MSEFDQRMPADQAAAQVVAARLVRRTLKQWKLIVGIALLFAIGGYVAAELRTKEYDATTIIQLNTVDLQSVFLEQNLQQQGDDAATKTATNAKLVTLPRVREAASRALGGRISPDDVGNSILVAPEAGTTLVNIVARNKDPRMAQQIADAVREAFIEVRRQTAVAQLNTAIADLDTQLADVPEAENTQPAAVRIRERRRELGTLRAVTNGGVEPVQTARLPTDPVGASSKRFGILGLLLGGLLGSAIAFLRARFDPRIREVDELTELWDLPVLGLIPTAPSLKEGKLAETHGATLEAFALARTNLRYLHVGGEVKTIVVTSALEGEGKSTVVWNLAVAAAQAGTKVLVIEADLRRPVLASRVGLLSTTGLSEILAGIAPISDALQRVDVGVALPSDAFVDVLPAGASPPSPVALLERPALRELLERASTGYDLVIVDTPPATVVADAKVVLHNVDGVVLVSRIGKVTRPSFERLRNLLADGDTAVLGLVVNGVDSLGPTAYTSSYYQSTATPAASVATPSSTSSETPAPETSPKARRPRNLTRS